MKVVLYIGKLVILHCDFVKVCNIYSCNCFLDVEKTSVKGKVDDGTGDEEEDKKSGSDSEDDR
jgi:hypothetical protein